jgi:CRISPR-associated protein Cmr5
MPSMIANKSQEQARFAYQSVFNTVKTAQPNEDANTKKIRENFNDKFKGHIKDVPMMIRTNGLAAAFAFIFSKKQKDEAYSQIEKITKDWFIREGILEETDSSQFHEVLITFDPDKYRRCSREIMALFTWLKRYADGLVKD